MWVEENRAEYQRARNKRLHDAGRCVSCTKPMEAGDTRMLCAACRDRQYENHKARKAALQAQGKCVQCGSKLPKDYPYEKCADCLATQSKKHREHRNAYLEQGLCTDCGGERENKLFLLCENCRRIRREAQKRYLHGGNNV